MDRLKAVLDFGEAGVEPLIAALNHKHANPIAKALGLLMDNPAAERAVPKLLSWLVTQSPLYSDVLEALVRAGDKTAGQVFILIRDYADKDDDEAVRNLFDLACRFSDAVLPDVAAVAQRLLEHPNPELREIAADVIWKIGLPYGRTARAQLQSIATSDPCDHVRQSAVEALEKVGTAEC
jgi:HEAT repeat protein